MFIIGSCVSFFAIRPLLIKRFEKNNIPDLKTNADAIIGREVIVDEDIAEDGYGRVLVDGDNWKAKSNSGAISKGEKVVVVSRDSIILTVSRLM